MLSPTARLVGEGDGEGKGKGFSQGDKYPFICVGTLSLSQSFLARASFADQAELLGAFLSAPFAGSSVQSAQKFSYHFGGGLNYHAFPSNGFGKIIILQHTAA
jgi:hypothetical protein